MKTTIIPLLLAVVIAGCSSPQPQPAKRIVLNGTKGLPPRAPEAPPRLPTKKMVYRTGSSNNIIQSLGMLVPAFGYSHRTHATNHSKGLKPVSSGSRLKLVGGIRPASVGTSFLADHGPVYSTTNNIPYPVVFVGADYQLKAGFTYYFEATADFANWYEIHDPYFSPVDDVYSSFINESVNGFHYPKYFQRVRATQ